MRLGTSPGRGIAKTRQTAAKFIRIAAHIDKNCSMNEEPLQYPVGITRVGVERKIAKKKEPLTYRMVLINPMDASRTC